MYIERIIEVLKRRNKVALHPHSVMPGLVQIGWAWPGITTFICMSQGNSCAFVFPWDLETTCRRRDCRGLSSPIRSSVSRRLVCILFVVGLTTACCQELHKPLSQFPFLFTELGVCTVVSFMFSHFSLPQLLCSIFHPFLNLLSRRHYLCH